MALLFADPCGRFYSTLAQALQGFGYNAFGSTTILTSGLPAGAVESTAFNSTTNAVITINLPATSTAQVTVGFRFYCPNQIPAANQNIVVYNDSTSASQITFQTTTNGTIQAKLGGGNGTLLGTSSGTNLTANTWNYLEFQLFVSSTVGNLAVRINNTQILSLSGINTQGGANNTIATITLAGINTTGAMFQDIYITDNVTSNPLNPATGFLGDVSMAVLNANRQGTFNQYAPNGAATNFQCVADTTPDDLTTYTFDSTPGDRVSFGYASVATSNPIVGVVHISRVEKSDSGARTFAQTITSNSVDSVATAVAPGTTFAYSTQILTADPATGTTWTVASVNAIQGGVKTVS